MAVLSIVRSIDATDEVQLAVLDTMEHDMSAVLAHRISHLKADLRSFAKLGNAGVLTPHHSESYELPILLVPPRFLGPCQGHIAKRLHLSGR